MAKKKRKPSGGGSSAPSTARKVDSSGSNLKRVQKTNKQKKENRQYTKFLRELRSGSGGSESRLLLSSGKASTKSRSMQSFRAIVDTVQDVAVVDMKPGCLGVEFTTKENKQKKVTRVTVPDKRDLPEEILQSLPGQGMQEKYFDVSTSPSEEEEDGASDEVYIVDMDGKQEGTKNGTSKSRKQHRSTRSSTSPLRHPKKTTRSSLSSSSSSSPGSNLKQQVAINYEKSSGTQKQHEKQKPGDQPSTSLQQDENTTASNRQQPRLRQLSKVQQQDISGPSSSLSSDRSEMESDYSEEEMMSDDESGNEEGEVGEEVGEEDETAAYFARYNKKGYRIFPHTIPTHCITVIHPHSVLPFYGQVKMSVIHGEVNVHGCVANNLSAPLDLYSPKSSAALCIETPVGPMRLDQEDTGSKQELEDKLRQFFMREHADRMIKEVLGLIQEHGVSVFAVESHWSDRTDFITSFPPYSELFQRSEFVRRRGKGNTLKEAADIGFVPIKPNPYVEILTTPPFYHTVREAIMKAFKQSGPGRPPIILVCGWRNVGKSTLVRYIINSMLSSSDSVCLLDCDVGQTEFNPPAMLGVTKVTEPLLGPPFTHEAKPERMCFFGDNTPACSPSVYMRAIKYLFQYYISHLSDLPLVVNYMGWMKGLGLSLLVDTIRHIEPSHILQLLPTPEPKKPPILNQTYIQQAKGWSNRECSREMTKKGEWSPEYMLINTPWSTREVGKYKAAHRRELSLLGNLSQLMPPKLKFHDPQATFDPLPALEPYSVPWRSVAVHICNANVAPSQLMYALNASVVGLCRADRRQMVSLDSEDANNMPKVFQSTPVCECFGLGIIRGIDPVTKVFYIITHLPQTTLKDVNTLLKGSLALPKFVLQQGQRKGVTPYVTSDFPHDVTGTGSIKVKYMVPQGQGVRH